MLLYIYKTPTFSYLLPFIHGTKSGTLFPLTFSFNVEKFLARSNKKLSVTFASAFVTPAYDILWQHLKTWAPSTAHIYISLVILLLVIYFSRHTAFVFAKSANPII